MVKNLKAVQQTDPSDPSYSSIARAASFACLGVLLFVSAALPAEELQGLSLAVAQPLHGGETTATGCVVPRFHAAIGARVSGHIAQWGADASGQPLDAGMAVKTGQQLFVVDARSFQAHVDTAQAALDAAAAALTNLKAPMRKERLDVWRAQLAELDARLKDRQHDLARYSRLVEVDGTLPLKRLEEVQLDLELLRAQRDAAQARLDEALAGPTKTEIAVCEAAVKQAQTALDAARLDLHDTVVTAPFDGVVTRRMKGLGDYVSNAPFVEVLELTSQAAPEVELNLPEAYFARIVTGQTRVALHSAALACDLDLPVARVIPEIDAQRGTFAFRVALPPEQAGALVAGSFVSATVCCPVPVQGTIVPQRAVMRDGAHSFVLVAEGGKMARRNVELGNHLTEGVIVKAGVRPGETVVVGASGEVPDGTALPGYLGATMENHEQPKP